MHLRLTFLLFFGLAGTAFNASLFADPASAISPTASSAGPATDDVRPLHIPPVGTAAPDRFFNVFRPFRTEAATLSPDGKRLAYSIREGEFLYVVTFDINDPSRSLAKILVGTADTSTPFLEPSITEKTLPRIRWMGWATPDRLVIETNASLPTPASVSGGIFAVNADGTNPRALVTPRDVAITGPKEFAPVSEFDDYRILTPDIDPEEEQARRERIAAGILSNFDNDLPTDVQSPRSPAFFDYAADDPEWIVVRTSDPRSYGLYRVHIGSGRLRYGKSENVAGDFATLVNRQGLVGGVVPNTMRSSFPHSFQVAKPMPLSLGRWSALSNIARNTAADFKLSPENFFGERSFPVGFDENPDILYYASNVGRDTYAIYGLNLKTGLPAGRMIESERADLAFPGPDGLPARNPLVFDRYTRELVGVRYQSTTRTAVWLRSDLRTVQASLEKTFPGRSVDVLEWDKDASRYLALVRGPTEPGAFYVVDRPSHQAITMVRRSDLPSESEPRFSRYFSIDNPAGGQITGLVVIPNAVRQKPIPVVVLCADDPWKPAPAEFDGEINALAQMGFAVLQINPRGTWGFGARYRAAAGPDFTETQTADIVTAIDELAKELPIHPDRVAIMGQERGGFLALRAAQLRPDRFRCVVGIEPTVNLDTWIKFTRWTTNESAPALSSGFFGEHLLTSNPLFSADLPHRRPAFILAYRGNEGGPATPMYHDARTLAHAIKEDIPSAQFKNLSPDYVRRMPDARSDIMRHIEDFLNLNIYAHDVKVGEVRVSGIW